ncbi:hypothetical protein T440DRAFT_555823 [Plenodomus tracheiphilus IPT5]|uniref:Uncharacterized protein n=1 Tax=Plenodomus tracheiphilus IPT5 TaxID=1408161 RepID=A0A6A7B4Z8_9PLEO|nr:hypothetical protein T440DRAFT_555823 [Plenodomus tracheiphilus IPT5]
MRTTKTTNSSSTQIHESSSDIRPTKNIDSSSRRTDESAVDIAPHNFIDTWYPQRNPVDDTTSLSSSEFNRQKAKLEAAFDEIEEIVKVRGPVVALFPKPTKEQEPNTQERPTLSDKPETSFEQINKQERKRNIKKMFKPIADLYKKTLALGNYQLTQITMLAEASYRRVHTVDMIEMWESFTTELDQDLFAHRLLTTFFVLMCALVWIAGFVHSSGQQNNSRTALKHLYEVLFSLPALNFYVWIVKVLAFQRRLANMQRTPLN